MCHLTDRIAHTIAFVTAALAGTEQNLSGCSRRNHLSSLPTVSGYHTTELHPIRLMESQICEVDEVHVFNLNTARSYPPCLLASQSGV